MKSDIIERKTIMGRFEVVGWRKKYERKNSFIKIARVRLGDRTSQPPTIYWKGRKYCIKGMI